LGKSGIDLYRLPFSASFWQVVAKAVAPPKALHDAITASIAGRIFAETASSGTAVNPFAQAMCHFYQARKFRSLSHMIKRHHSDIALQNDRILHPIVGIVLDRI